MKTTVSYLALFIWLPFMASCQNNSPKSQTKPTMSQHQNFPVQKSEEEWKKSLTPAQFDVLRKKGTERAFTSELYTEKRDGVYQCAACNEMLFTSDTKYESHCGWPSFYGAVDNKRIKLIADRSYGMTRTEIVCAKCGGHLGHIFEDGPTDKTGQRYCVNGLSLKFTSVDRKELPQSNVERQSGVE